MKIAIVGCGYIAASYARALPHHPELSLTGAWDINSDNLARFVSRWPCRRYETFADLLSDPAVETVVNLTNPRSHATVTDAALKSGKHVYSEKPLGMTGDEARRLVEIARDRGVLLTSAPCSVLSETAQTVMSALRSGVIGRVRLGYANFDDGMIAPHEAPWGWVNDVGVPWPAKDEFEIGCTYEHAGYHLTWLAAFFGPVRHVTAFASCQMRDKGIEVDTMAPDFTVGCLEYDDDVVVRLTCGLVAPRDKSLLLVGDKGVLAVENVRNERCAVRYRLYEPTKFERAVMRVTDGVRRELHMDDGQSGKTRWRRYPYVSPPPSWMKGHKPVDFLRGLSEMEAALREARPCLLPAELGWHVAEIVAALQHPPMAGGRQQISATFPPLEWGAAARAA